MKKRENEFLSSMWYWSPCSSRLLHRKKIKDRFQFPSFFTLSPVPWCNDHHSFEAFYWKRFNKGRHSSFDSTEARPYDAPFAEPRLNPQRLKPQNFWTVHSNIILFSYAAYQVWCIPFVIDARMQLFFISFIWSSASFVISFYGKGLFQTRFNDMKVIIRAIFQFVNLF